MESISEESSLRDDLGLTSFDLAELTVHIEDEFDIDIFEDGLVSTVGEIYTKLDKEWNLFWLIMIRYILIKIC